MAKLLLENKLTSEDLLYGAMRCIYLIDVNFLDIQKAIMALDFANRASLTVDQALIELGWTVRTRLRSL